MSEDQFTKLFNHMNKRFDAVDDRFEQIEDRFNKRFDILTNIIDGYAGKLITIHQGFNL